MAVPVAGKEHVMEKARTKRETQIREAERRHVTCLTGILKPVSEKAAFGCRHGSGMVPALEDIEDDNDFEWALGLYEQLLETVDRYIGCKRSVDREFCEIMYQRHQTEIAARPETPYSGKNEHTHS